MCLGIKWKVGELVSKAGRVPTMTEHHKERQHCQHTAKEAKKPDIQNKQHVTMNVWMCLELCECVAESSTYIAVRGPRLERGRLLGQRVGRRRESGRIP